MVREGASASVHRICTTQSAYAGWRCLARGSCVGACLTWALESACMFGRIDWRSLQGLCGGGLANTVRADTWGLRARVWSEVTSGLRARAWARLRLGVRTGQQQRPKNASECSR